LCRYVADFGGLLEFNRVVVVVYDDDEVTSWIDIEEDLLAMGEVQGDWLGGVYGIRTTVV
jgi:hypothetical protein